MQATPTTRLMRAFQPFPAAVCLCALAAGGCASKPAAAPPTAATSSPAELPPSAPSVRAAENGMEMMWWGVSTTSRTLAELLAPSLDDSLGIDPRTRALWQSNGLRLVAVPIERLDTLRQLLRQSGGVERQWLGQVPVWTNIIHGSPWPDIQAVDMDNGRLSLGPGRLRVLLRCWTMPVPPAPGFEGADAGIRTAMRAEMLLQHQEPPRIDPASIYSRPTDVTNPIEEGLVFKRLAASITLSPDRALLVIPESPEVDWRSIAQIPEDQLADDTLLAETRDPFAPPTPPVADEPVGVGQVLRERAGLRRVEPIPEPERPGPIDPSADTARTLGELLLSPSRARIGTNLAAPPAIRSILVLVPRIPDQFRLDSGAKP